MCWESFTEFIRKYVAIFEDMIDRIGYKTFFSDIYGWFDLLNIKLSYPYLITYK